jgi:hypothetical protein
MARTQERIAQIQSYYQQKYDTHLSLLTLNELRSQLNPDFYMPQSTMGNKLLELNYELEGGSREEPLRQIREAIALGIPEYQIYIPTDQPYWTFNEGISRIVLVGDVHAPFGLTTTELALNADVYKLLCEGGLDDREVDSWLRSTESNYTTMASRQRHFDPRYKQGTSNFIQDTTQPK